MASGCENVCEKEKCDYGVELCMAVENPFYVLIASGGDVLVAPDCTLSRIRKIREMWRKRNVWRSARPRSVVKS